MERKIRELRYAIALEKRLTKDQILERYLNIAYYGEGAYGVEAAARHYFSTTAAKLTLPQAAMLAGLVQNPDAQQPGAQPERGARPARRRDQPDGRAGPDHPGAGGEGQEGQASTRRRSSRPATAASGTRYPFLCDYVRRTLLQHPEPRQDRRGAART